MISHVYLMPSVAVASLAVRSDRLLHGGYELSWEGPMWSVSGELSFLGKPFSQRGTGAIVLQLLLFVSTWAGASHLPLPSFAQITRFLILFITCCILPNLLRSHIFPGQNTHPWAAPRTWGRGEGWLATAHNAVAPGLGTELASFEALPSRPVHTEFWKSSLLFTSMLDCFLGQMTRFGPLCSSTSSGEVVLESFPLNSRFSLGSSDGSSENYFCPHLERMLTAP